MNLTKFMTILCLTAAGAGGCGFDSNPLLSVRSGDLIFRDSDCGPLCDAIEKVTKGFKGANLSHVGIVAEDVNCRMVVLEAVSRGVAATDLQEFLYKSSDNNSPPKVVVGRLKKPYRHLIPAVIKEAEALKGKPYDKGFLIDNDAYYCSELIYEIFNRANKGEPVFKLEPMTFKDPETEETMAVWREYFEKLGIDIPEGEPGINPGGISRSPVIAVVYISDSVSRKTK